MGPPPVLSSGPVRRSRRQRSLAGRRVPAVTGRDRRVANSTTEPVYRPRSDPLGPRQPRDKRACRLLQLLTLPPRVYRVALRSGGL